MNIFLLSRNQKSDLVSPKFVFTLIGPDCAPSGTGNGSSAACYETICAVVPPVNVTVIGA
mgnify:CR=1 FL=1